MQKDGSKTTQKRYIPFTDKAVSKCKPNGPREIVFFKDPPEKGNKLKPCVVMKMNSRDPLVIIDFEDFLKLIKVDD